MLVILSIEHDFIMLCSPGSVCHSRKLPVYWNEQVVCSI